MVAQKPSNNGHATDAKAQLPPVSEMAVATLILIVLGGIDIAARLPKEAALLLPIILLAAAVAVLGANVVSLTRIDSFAWSTFFLVGKYALLAYVVIAGMLEFVFILDGTPTKLLVMLSLMLLVFAVDIPLLFAFSVARYQLPDPTPDR